MLIEVATHSSIYFHNPKKVRADEWMFTEMVSPWAGDGRGLVMQKIFSRDGTLLATAIQEVSSVPPLARLFHPLLPWSCPSL
jgi:acyl-CoA thioesterase II